MSTTSTYYVPEQSKLPIFASLGFLIIAIGGGSWLNGSSNGPTIFMLGSFLMAAVVWCWFSTVIKENMAGLNNTQLKRSYVWGMSWFIFSEVMFFAAFFGALFYIRTFALPWLGGAGNNEMTNQILWQGFESTWPLMTTPDAAVNGDAAKIVGPEQSMSYKDVESIWGWLPLWNTIVLLTSSVTVHFAHTALKNDNRKGFTGWLGFTVLLGIVFLFLQVEEYIHAYTELGLTLESGIYGATFFMLTGFHGAHVTLGTLMLLIMFLRGLKGHFTHDDCFGFEAASWYWHFVDVVWVALFLFVYILG
ncbi:MAG: cytochrome c oxidase subunit 3 [Gammaproteobacteria bacterium]|nr:cytochrome c oxidase subunit 3 [Gammaproteobacteria bacterium]